MADDERLRKIESDVAKLREELKDIATKARNIEAAVYRIDNKLNQM